MEKFGEQWKKFPRASVASLLFEASFDDLLRLPFILAHDMRNISANIAQTALGSRVKAILGAVSDNVKYWFGGSRRKVFSCLALHNLNDSILLISFIMLPNRIIRFRPKRNFGARMMFSQYVWPVESTARVIRDLLDSYGRRNQWQLVVYCVHC